MSVVWIFGSWASWNKLRGNDDDDWVDRVNHIYTVVLLCIFAVFTGGGQYVGNPIECWCPAQFTGSYVSYTKSYCWIKNTYYVPLEEAIPLDHGTRRQEELTYYQWVPIILVFMAFLFKVPCLVWRMLNSYSGLNLEKIVNMSAGTQTAEPKKRDETVKHIAVYIDRWLETHRQYNYNFMVRMKQKASKICCIMCNKREGTYLTGLYMFVKILYCVNVICQFFILNAFMGHGFYSAYGLEVLQGLANNWEINESPRFPRVTLCDFDIRQLQNLQRWTVQCVLPINLFNEKIFIFLWFWFVLVAIVTCGNFLFWVWRVLVKQNRVAYIKKFLKVRDELHGEDDKKVCRQFADQYLRDDGLFVLRIIARNTNAILLTDLVLNLWGIYKEKPLVKKALSDDYGETHA
ncbi:innexin unc-9-like [Ostrea edulis]|uniref:innexin unc-9-like n=1 Tax=Ostrea edulis TaxID=37623 RepID=UPI0020953E30|nr:innexin unc-9-like [Ostrea edulis]